ncbi:class I SAM-dependent methyltransferase [Amycolatopsis acidicola]|uniref:Class I SAM-dependent methyltransferase n=1 Tax=Amycolatopsis acidicola TaxID=2596893 RepID=A0A5N0UVK4_9PSEU|nr:class I SAM-dependent methyltransferase [Amycolatopsis acidicola]KAA9155931.1 class I SAM-dependent methyltransferase [Amycolatopsis acidicola]
MKTRWDYTELAETYSLRPRYADAAVDRIVALPDRPRPSVADLGAGTGHLTLDLAARGCLVDAVEPNAAMASIGRRRTAHLGEVRWFTGTGEETGLATGAYDLVTYGSSFNTMDREAALREAARLVGPRGHIACVWNHRDLSDPLQTEIECLIRSRIPEYDYGSRREDQAPVIDASGLFGPAEPVSAQVWHRVRPKDWIAAWRSHGTLRRQAGPLFDELVDGIQGLVEASEQSPVLVPYLTVGWVAPRREAT